MNLDNRSNEPKSPWAMGILVAAGFVAAVLRIIPHPPNFSSIGAIGLFGGARLRGWQAYLMPLGIMILSDICLWILTGFDPLYSVAHQSRLYVYGSFMIYVLIGRCLRNTNSITSVIAAAAFGGIQFFVVTNFCTWLFQPYDPSYSELPEVFRYSRNWDGLVQCFVMALPFYSTSEVPLVPHHFMMFTDHRFGIFWTVVGDVFFTCLYLSIHATLVRPNPAAEGAAVDDHLKVSA